MTDILPDTPVTEGAAGGEGDTTEEKVKSYLTVDQGSKDDPTELSTTFNASVANLKTWHEVEKVSLAWRSIVVEVGKGDNKKQILKNCTGNAPPGKIVAIIGPSGAGKTTLLKTLSGQMPYNSGEILYEGAVKKNMLADNDVMGFQGNAAFVTQENLIMGSLTVRETFYYAAKLKITDPDVEIDERVNNIIDYLGLRKCADTKVGTVFFKGISGGEKRRTAMGVELVTQPALLFLDEPTSGLDATSAYNVMFIAHRLAELGHSVIMTLHQPSSRIFEMLLEWDDILMILEHGRQMYTGPIREAEAFFDKMGFGVPRLTNPLDYFMDVVNSDFQHSTQNSNKCGEAFKTVCVPKLDVQFEALKEESKLENRVVRKPVQWFLQVWYLMQRNFLNNLRNPAIYGIRIVMYSMLAFCLGTLYWKIGDDLESQQDRISILFFVAAFLTFMSIAGMPAFVEERSLFIRERMNEHYCTSAYVMANFLSSVPWIFLIALASSFFIQVMIQSRSSGDVFGIYLMNLFVALLVAESMMVTISAISPHFMVGLAAGGGFLGLYMIVCGFFLLPKNIPVGWIWVHYGVSFHTYSFQIFMVNEFRDFNPPGGIVGNDVLEMYDMQDVSIGENFVILLAMLFVYRVFFFLALRFFNKSLK